MSNEQPSAQRFPLGRILFAIGLIAILAVIALTFYRTYTGTRAVYASIPDASPTTITLPSRGKYAFTRDDALTNDRTLAATIVPSNQGRGPTEITNDTANRWITTKGQRSQILADFTASSGGQLTITAQAAAYPIEVRREPLDWSIRILKQAAIAGTIAALITVAGAVIGIRAHNANARERMRIIEQLTE